MDQRNFASLNFESLSTPCYIVNTDLLESNGKILQSVANDSGAHILFALKAFSNPKLLKKLMPYLSGAAASGLWEARLGKKILKKEIHTYSPAFSENEFPDILKYSDKIIFNSPSQIRLFASFIKKLRLKKQFGLRLNPQHSETETALYDPTREGSRLGTTLEEFDEAILPFIDGFHMHTLCEKNSDALIRTFSRLEKDFSRFFHRLKWINLGGGHHITKESYDKKALIELIHRIRSRYNLDVYLEPGEAGVIGSGLLCARVLDTMKNGSNIAILDVSATAHMPDILEMPYRPTIWNAGGPNEKKFDYILGGPTCLAGDQIGTYSFDRPLKRGDLLAFEDMTHYTMVKTTTFNGVRHPSIYSYSQKTKKLRLLRKFGFRDFLSRIR
jgi:carboxynorspermidine decarboxylase